LREAAVVFSNGQKAQGGAVVSLDEDGSLRVVRGLIAPADIKAAKPKTKAKALPPTPSLMRQPAGFPRSW
jgi:hypothetical protein